MSHIDTLNAYDSLIGTGVSPAIARAQVKLLDESLDEVVTKEYLKQELSALRNEIKIDIGVIKGDIALLVVLPIVIGFAAQILLKKVGWI